MLTILVTIGMMNNMFMNANIMIYVVMDLIIGIMAVVWYIWTKIERVLKNKKDSSRKAVR